MIARGKHLKGQVMWNVPTPTAIAAPLFVLCASTASAESGRPFCASAKAAMVRAAPLASAARAAFPTAGYARRDDDCIYPLKLLRYDDADALFVIGGKPGDACHACRANVSAYVMRGAPGGPTVVARFANFTSTGFFGDPGRIDAVQLAGHDAFALETGSLFQGYAASSVSFFVFEAGRLVELKPFLPLSADNSGAMGDDLKSTSIEGSWRVEQGRPEAITVTYTVKVQGRERRAAATWIVEGDRLLLTSGRVPPEVEGRN